MKPAFPALFLGALFVVFSIIGALLLVGSTVATHPFKLVFGILFCIGAVAIAARPATYVLTRKSGSFFFPSEHTRNPPPAYSIAEACRIKGDFAEALQRYEEIVCTHPQVLRAYVAMVEIAVDNVNDNALAKRMLDRGLAAISSQNGKRHLQDSYDECLARREKCDKRSGMS